ncbi:unnamed protein product [Mytilus edulis]|uniref:Uncharacterized protein n=1 Tax=Mytilus edulis TaxID=6550 RepID=A0A8S3T6H9_MYTED|nr:unnamed protein product [Mytilus edulis]
MISRDNVETVKILFTKLCDRYEHFKAAHLECLDSCTNSDIIETLEINFDSSQRNFIEFRERYNEWIREPEKAKEEEDNNSRITSVSRSSLSTQYRLKLARANRLKAEVQVKKMVEKQELERARREIEMKEQILASTLQEGFNLPKPELLTFDGKPTDYCKFIKNFETNVECRVTDDQLKLSYLIQYNEYCKGEAKSSIEDCVLLEKKGYERARSILHPRYGRSHMIVRSYIESLVYGAPIKASDFESHSKLALEMQKCEITLSQLGYVSDIDNTNNLRKIVKRLPMHLRVKWVDIAHSITETRTTAPSVDVLIESNTALPTDRALGVRCMGLNDDAIKYKSNSRISRYKDVNNFYGKIHLRRAIYTPNQTVAFYAYLSHDENAPSVHHTMVLIP